MKIKELLMGFKDIKVIGSLIGGIFVSGGNPFVGNVIWFILDIFWVKHYHDRKDMKSLAMFVSWTFIALYGIVTWWP